MARLFNIARVVTATTGTGTVTLGAAVSGYLTFANAGVQDGHVVSYTIFEGANRETGIGTYTSSGTTLSRDTVINSTAGGTTKITLAGAAEVMITALAEDIVRPVYLKGHIDGLILSNNVTDANNDIDIGAGVAVSDDGTYLMELASAITKRLDANWAVGTNQGGLDTSSEAISTWYHIWLIARPDTGVVDALFSASATAPTMPTNYTKKRRIGAVLNNASSNLVAFDQFGDEFVWDAGVVDVNAANPGTSAVTRTLTVPTGIRVRASLVAGAILGTSAHVVWLSSLDSSDQTPQTASTASLTNMGMANAYTAAGWNFASTWVMTNTSAQIRSRISVSDAASRIGIITRGWIDPRGRVW